MQQMIGHEILISKSRYFTLLGQKNVTFHRVLIFQAMQKQFLLK